jgi:hypothetical protein
MEVSGRFHAPVALPPVPIGGPLSRYGRASEKKKIPSPAGNRTSVVHPLAQSLYSLSYRDSARKVKVKLPLDLIITPWRCILYLNKHHAMKTYRVLN